MKKNLSSYLFKGFLVLLILSLPLLSLAITTDDYGLTETAAKAGLWTEKPKLFLIISRVINVILSVLGVIFVTLIIVAGIQWMTAGGNTEAIQQARTRITNALIGLIIILCALSISYFVIERLKKITEIQKGGGIYFEVE